MDIEIVKII